jgi:hypothetical protein
VGLGAVEATAACDGAVLAEGTALGVLPPQAATNTRELASATRRTMGDRCRSMRVLLLQG